MKFVVKFVELKKNIFLSLVSFTIASIIGIILFQGYWIYTAWENKEEEFSLSVQQSIQKVSKEVQERELSDYISAYERYIDSIGSPDNANFAEVYLFLDDDKSNDLMSYYAYGILQEEYNIKPYLAKNDTTSIVKMTDFKREVDDNFVPDPYYGGDDGFEKVLDIVEDCSFGLLDYIKKQI